MAANILCKDQTAVLASDWSAKQELFEEANVSNRGVE